MKPNLAANLRNILAVARREFMFRGRTRTFRLTTVLLVVVGVALALAPVIIQFIDRGSTGERVEIYVGDSKPGVDAVTIVGAILNAPSAGTTTTPNAKPDYIIEPVTDLEAARAKVVDGGASAVLAMSRVASGDLSFTVYSKDSILSRRNQLLQVAAGQVAVQDRLVRAGLDLGQFQQLNAPPAFVLSAGGSERQGSARPASRISRARLPSASSSRSSSSWRSSCTANGWRSASPRRRTVGSWRSCSRRQHHSSS